MRIPLRKNLICLFVLFLLIIPAGKTFSNKQPSEFQRIINFIEKDIDSALILMTEYYNKSLNNNVLWETAISSEALGLIYEKMEEHRKALDYYIISLQQLEKTDSTNKIAEVNIAIGLMHYWIGEYELATDYYMRAIKLGEELNNNNILARSYQNMAMLYSIINDIELSLKYYDKALRIANENPELLSNKAGILQNVGIIYANQEKPELAIQNYKQALEIYNSLGETVNQAIIYNNMGVLFERKELSDSTLFYYKKALDIFYEIEFKRGISVSLYNVGQTYRNKKQYDLALEYVYKSQEVAEEIELKDQIQNNYYELSWIYELKEDFETSLEYMILAYDWKDTLYTIEQANRITELERKYETEKKEQHILLQEAQIKEKTVRNFGLTATSVLALLLALFIYINLRSKKKLNLELKDKNQQLAHRNKQITHSITYASFIQAAILPPLNLFREYFPENFILFKPKDIVSGDFYWITKKENRIIIAIADCTGHGVPGALMSMLGMTFLNEIVNIYDEQDTGRILDILREKIINALRQKDKLNDSRDGMDIALCSIDIESKTLKYSGAYLPVYIASNNHFYKLEPNRMPIGYHKTRNGNFFSQNYKLQPKDVLYIYTDGFPDQFGMVKSKKFTRQRLNSILEKNHHKPLQEQKELAEKELNDWKGTKEQIDDITLIGLKI